MRSLLAKSVAVISKRLKKMKNTSLKELKRKLLVLLFILTLVLFIGLGFTVPGGSAFAALVESPFNRDSNIKLDGYNAAQANHGLFVVEGAEPDWNEQAAALEAEFEAAELAFADIPSAPNRAARREAAQALVDFSAKYVAANLPILYSVRDEKAIIIDEGGLRFLADGSLVSESFNTFGTKWGAGSPFAGGQDVPGPGLPGGNVTYSFMASGISMAAEGSPNSVAVTAMAGHGVGGCFFDVEIAAALPIWAALADISFSQVADNGVAFNASGATGDIRIAGHAFDGQFGVLAHAYFPPPNGTTAAGDAHYDTGESWGCVDGSGNLDLGIVAIHETGHSVGLGHEPDGGNPAIMQPFYNPAVPLPLTDDINGIRSIYGTVPPPTPTDTPTLIPPTPTNPPTPIPTNTPVPPTDTPTPTSTSLPGTIPLVDAVSSGTTSGTSLTISHTTSGSDRLMLVGISINNDDLETV